MCITYGSCKAMISEAGFFFFFLMVLSRGMSEPDKNASCEDAFCS